MNYNYSMLKYLVLSSPDDGNREAVLMLIDALEEAGVPILEGSRAAMLFARKLEGKRESSLAAK